MFLSGACAWATPFFLATPSFWATPFFLATPSFSATPFFFTGDASFASDASRHFKWGKDKD